MEEFGNKSRDWVFRVRVFYLGYYFFVEVGKAGIVIRNFFFYYFVKRWDKS